MSLGSVILWFKETWRDQLPPVTNFVVVNMLDVPGDPNLIYMNNSTGLDVVVVMLYS